MIYTADNTFIMDGRPVEYLPMKLLLLPGEVPYANYVAHNHHYMNVLSESAEIYQVTLGNPRGTFFNSYLVYWAAYKKIFEAELSECLLTKKLLVKV